MSDAIEARFQELDDLAAIFAENIAQKEYLEDFKKSKLAILMKKYEAKGVSAVGAQERDARADDEYIELLKGLQAATEAMELSRWKLKNAHGKMGIWQTQQANRRAEMNLR